MSSIRILFKTSFLAICVFVVMFIPGCATTGKMVLTPERPTPNISPDNSIVLLVIETSKDGASGWSRLPIVKDMNVGEVSAKEYMPYKVPRNVLSCNDYRVKHLISLELTSNEYLIQGISGQGLVCDEVRLKMGTYLGNFFFDLKLIITPISGKVVYAGHIKANMRGRKSKDEIRAGSPLPLIDQAITGFYSTTFDITIEDMFDEDMAMFRDKFPALNQMEIIKSIAARQNL